MPWRWRKHIGHLTSSISHKPAMKKLPLQWNKPFLQKPALSFRKGSKKRLSIFQKKNAIKTDAKAIPLQHKVFNPMIKINKTPFIDIPSFFYADVIILSFPFHIIYFISHWFKIIITAKKTSHQRKKIALSIFLDNTLCYIVSFFVQNCIPSDRVF